MAEAPTAQSEAEQNRPYRRFVVIVFFGILAVVSVLILRGIIGKLDRMPSVESFERAEIIDDRALRACADDLLRLEERVRREAAKELRALPTTGDGAHIRWQETKEGIEHDRLAIVARCQLEDPKDAVAKELQNGAESIEDLLRSTNLLLERHFQDGRAASEAARAAIERAQEALHSR